MGASTTASGSGRRLRTLFWIFTALFLIGAIFAISLFVGVRTSPGEGTGMVLIYFLPVSVLGIAAGLAALVVRSVGRHSLPAMERRLGWLVGGLVLLGICLLGLAFALE